MEIRGRSAATAAILGTIGAGIAGGFDTVVTPAYDLLVVHVPAVVVNTLLETIGGLAESLLTAAALVVAGIAFAAVALGAVAVAERFAAASGFVAPLLGAIAAIVVTLLTTGSISAAIGIAIAIAVVGGDHSSVASGTDRRRFLHVVGATVAVVVPSAIVGRIAGDPLPPPEPIELDEADHAAVEDHLTRATERSFDLPDSPGLVSSTDEFYTVDIAHRPPPIDRSEWALSIDGSVRTPLVVEFEDLYEEPFVTEPATLRCIGEPLNGRLMDTAVWTGVPLSQLLERADLEGDHAVVHGADDYFERLPVRYLEDAILSVAMNGESLPRSHGYPARLVMPGTWGKINTKWIDRIDIREEPGEGYWTNRGWNGTAAMRIVAKLWSIDWTADRVQVGGHAYAGDRGISVVEISTDGGETWAEAELSAPVSEAATAVSRQWRYRWTPQRDSYDVVVRARDRDGRLQERSDDDPFPDEASGWVERTISRS